MSIKDLFSKNQQPTQVLNSDSIKNLSRDVESERYVEEKIIDKEKFFPQVDYSDPSNFARFGLAEEYYKQAFKRVYDTFPYDGSRYEVQKWFNSSSYFDDFIFENEYPRTTGYAIFGDNWGTQIELLNGYGAPATASYEYILIKGGPNKDPNNTSLKDMFPSNAGEANVFNVNANRDSNLKISGVQGNTIEFWMKKKAFDTSNKTQKEVILDVFSTSSISSSAGYGRFRLEMHGDASSDTAATLTNAINVTSVGNDHAFTLTSPIAMGGDGVTYTFKFVHGLNQVDGASGNVYYISRHSDAGGTTALTSAQRATALANAINGLASPYAAFSDGNVGSVNSVDLKITADASDGDGTIDLTFDLIGDTGNEHPNVLAATNGFAGSKILTTAFTGGAGKIGPFLVTYMSGTRGIATASIGDGVTPSTIADEKWHHYGVSVKNYQGQLRTRLYIDGQFNHEAVTGSSIGIISSSLVGTIASLGVAPSSSIDYPGIVPERGWGKLSASLDEFRYWKKERTAQDIGRNYFTNVYGGSNTDISNTELGVYYKFNEGITGTSSIDEVVLDYSGRLSNGSWTGYSSTNSTSFRNTGSAIDESHLTGSEFKDPIMRSTHPDVSSKLNILEKKGRLHDLDNTAAMYFSIPEWITSEDRTSGQNLVKLTQIISSYFDSLAMQIKSLPGIKAPTYPSSSYKPLPFADKLLENHGLLVPELFTDSTILQQFAQQDETREFDKDLREVKNLIYKNIYNNLAYIYKSKGTEKAFRNLIRCFGIDDQIIKVNIYGDNAIYNITGNYNHTVTKKKCLDFNAANRNSAAVFQYLDSSDPDSNTVSFITSSNGFLSGSARTLEAEVIFPKAANHKVTNYEYLGSGSSLFGVHSVKSTEDDDAGADSADPVLPWPAEKNDYDLRVYAIRETVGGDDAYFKLKSTRLGIDLTSSLYKDVYNNEKWNFAVRLKRDIHPLATGITSSATFKDTDVSGSIEFYGVNAVQNYVKEEFLVSSSIVLNDYTDLVESAKRVYAGANRENFTSGPRATTAIIDKTDVKITSVRYWLDYLSDKVINAHAFDVQNFGTEHPYRNAYLFQGPDDQPDESAVGKFDFETSGSTEIPQMETLVLHWDFENVTGSDDSGKFVVKDVSSGSADSIRYGFIFAEAGTDSDADETSEQTTNSPEGSPLSKILKRQHSGLGMGWPTDSKKVVDVAYISNARQIPPEIIASSNMIEGRTRDDRLLTRSSRPVTHYIGIEKSPYQSVTEEMLKVFATLTEFNNLIGEPVNTYRQNYKNLEKLRQLFFERVDNIPDVDKYVDYYKWIDNAVDAIIHQLMPASANTSEHLSTMIESHVMERNKFRHKYPMVNSAEGNAEIEGLTTGRRTSTQGDDLDEDYETTGEGTLIDNPPTSPLNTKKAILWWKTRAERDKTAEISSGDATVDKQREIYRKIITSTTSPSGSSFTSSVLAKTVRYSAALQSEVEAGSNDGSDKRSNIYSRNVLKPFSATSRLRVTASNVMASESPALYGFKPRYDFESEPVPGIPSGKKERLRFAVQNVYDSTIVKDNSSVPFNVYTSSEGRTITDIHNDSYIGREIPLQGPFTEKYVGGLQYRHIQINSGSELDTKYTRPQGFKLIVSDESDLNNATATITITDYTELNSTDKVNLVATDGTNYNFTQGDQSSVNGTWEATTSNNQTATNLMNVINTSSGPAGTRFTATVNGAVVTVTQATGGTDGNTTVTLTDTGTAGMSKTDFTGGGNKTKLFRHPIIGTMLNYAPPDLDSNLTLDTELPRAMFYRDETAKRPVNIRNIKSGSYGIGNYKKDYEIVLTNARSINNKYYVSITGATSASVTNDNFSDFKDFALPERTRNESVIVNRFSAPGGPEVMSRGFLDTAAEEYSVYNALPYRNLTIRQPHQTLLKRYTSQFGEDSVFGSGSGSIHKVHRNTRYRLEYSGSTVITGTVRDNGFITHPIPQSDLQYAWITASAYDVSGGLVAAGDYSKIPFGYEKPNQQYAGASDSILFVSASETVFDGGVPIDFVGLNTIIFDEISSSLNLLYRADGGPGSIGTNTIFPTNTAVQIEHAPDGTIPTFNYAIVHRQGPFGWPSWKQIRTGEHPIVRYQKGRNIYNFYENDKPQLIYNIGSNFIGYKDNTQLKQYTIPVVTTKFKPISAKILNSEIEYTYANLNSYLLIDEGLLDEKYGIVKSNEGFNQTLENIQKQNIIKIKDVIYKEVVYPRAEFTTLAKTRERLGYAEYSGTGSNGYDRLHGTHRTFWRDRPNDRIRTNHNALNSMGISISGHIRTVENTNHSSSGDNYLRSGSHHPLAPLALSSWPLDSFHGGFMSGAGDSAEFPGQLNQADIGKTNTGATGELYAQNGLGFVSGADGGTFKESEQSFFFYQHYGWFGVDEGQTWPSEYYISASQKWKPGFDETNEDAAEAIMFHFKPQYSASVLSGLTPWYDSYKDYSENIRPIGKDYSIIPEFTISDHMEYYLNKGFKTKNNKYLSLPGAAVSDAASGSVLMGDILTDVANYNNDSADTSMNLTSSAGDEVGSINSDFYKIYSHSDFLDSFQLVKSVNSDKKISEITLTCKGIKKLLPYQGFYPVLRSVQLGTLLSQSFSPYLTGSPGSSLYVTDENGETKSANSEMVQALMQPFFAPGILYNTIKSGIAVDWPVMTGSTKLGDNSSFGYLGYLATGSSLDDKQYHNRRFPFESLVAPERHIPVALAPGAEQGASGSESRINMVVSPSFRSGTLTTATDVYGVETNAPHFIWKGEHDNKYNLAMHNFLGEIPRFFLEEQRLTTFASKKGPYTMVSGTTYYMDVVLEKTPDFIMYEGPHISMKETHPVHGVKYSSGSARGLHYGPACDTLGSEENTDSMITNTSNGNYAWLSNIQDPAFAPYTPPYFYGESVARIAFSPHRHRELLPSEVTQEFTLDEILEGAKVETIYEPNRTASYALATNTSKQPNDTTNLAGYIRVPSETSLAAVGKMKIDSSVNLFGKTRVKEVEYSTDLGPDGKYIPVSIKDSNNVNFDVWTISPKFECPTLNFSGNAKGHFTRGMWFGYGQQPSSSEGIFLRLRESFPQEIGKTISMKKLSANPDILSEQPETGSLIDVCGFLGNSTNSKRRIGKLANKKIISEAVVAIPFRARSKDSVRGFFDIPKDYVNIALGRASKKIIQKYEKQGIEVDDSIEDMVSAMQKYVIPPHHDFVKNKNIKPFVMYIFEFEHTLDRDDLSNIWQNLMPKIAKQPQLDQVSITHSCGAPGGFFENGDIPSDIKWMVYKVKRRAETSYYNITSDSQDDDRFKFEFNIDSEKSVPDYSYNWPYDFFSLVELAKVEVGIKLSALTKEEQAKCEELMKEDTKKCEEYGYLDKGDNN